jgi:hypothetical protein
MRVGYGIAITNAPAVPEISARGLSGPESGTTYPGTIEYPSEIPPQNSLVLMWRDYRLDGPTTC